MAKKGKQKKVRCTLCNKTYWQFLSVLNLYKKNFCSNECKKVYGVENSKNKILKLFCKNEFCKKEILTKKKTKKFCSPSCSSEYMSKVYKMKIKMMNDSKNIILRKINDAPDETRAKLRIRKNI